MTFQARGGSVRASGVVTLAVATALVTPRALFVRTIMGLAIGAPCAMF